MRNGEAAGQPDTLRIYDIRDQQGHLRPSYVIVIDRGGLGEFYDVQGTTWTDPPLLSNPSQTVHIGSRTYSLFYAGEEIRTIAWHEGGAAYWIQNTLTNGVQPREMLAMATLTRPVVSRNAGDAQATAAAIPNLRGLRLPPRELAATSPTSKLAAALSFVSLTALVLLALLALSRSRELSLLRDQVAQAMALEARQRPLVAAASAVASVPQPERAPTIYRTRKRLRGGMLAAAVPVAAILAVLAIRLSGAGLFASSASPGSSVPVAVFNATGTPGAAHRLASALKADRIHLGDVGNINVTLGSGVYVLYPPGAHTEAQRIARLILNVTVRIAPIQRQVQDSVGKRKEIVVIFD
jgi:hypothetical protein